jgi:DNA-directed RNA polymerase subunit RPC12/RpoP
MGMFDYIDLKIKCPKCGKIVDKFQSKDGYCELKTLNYWEVDNFYSSCKYCNAWIVFNRVRPKPIVPLTDFIMEVQEEEQEKLK